MEKTLPELHTKITPQKIKEANKLGKGTDLRNMVAGFKFFGTFGWENNSHRYIARRIYRTSTYEVIKDGQTTTEINDEEAYQRFDNILSGDKSMMEEEVGFFRQCIAYVVGETLAATIKPDQIRLGKAHVLIRDLLMRAPSLEWVDIDPLNAILALTSEGRERLNVTIEDKRYRLVKNKKTPTILFPESDEIVLIPDHEFYLHIQESEPGLKLKYEPMVLEFSYSTGPAKDGREFRAHILNLAKKVINSEDPINGEELEPNHWCCSGNRNRSLEVGDEKGRFGFLILGNAGQNISDYLPEGADPNCINNNDLKIMFEKLAQSASMENDIAYGLLNYTVL